MDDGASGVTTGEGGVTTGAVAPSEEPRILAITNKRVRTSLQFADLMSALMSDLADGRVAPQVANAMCNAGGKLLKVVEMQVRYGTPNAGRKTLALTSDADESA